MFDKIKKLFEDLTGEGGEERDLDAEQMRVAAAALLVHAIHVDGDVDRAESEKLRDILCSRFEISKDDAQRLIAEAELKEKDSVDLYGFTSVISRNLDQEGRQKIVEMLWEVVLADGVIHEFENNLVWRSAELLGVSTRDRVRLRKDVEARAAGS